MAATKTYVNTLASLALLAGHVAGRGGEVADGIRGAAELMEDAIPGLERSTAKLALSFSYTGRMFVIGRGVEFATAREIALKLLETCRIAAEPLTATDLAHGPVAALDPLFPVWAIASSDGTLSTVQEAASRTREMGASLVASGTAAERIKGAAFTVPVPMPEPALLSPLLSVVPGQLFASALSRARGLDPDAPHGLAKVTLARVGRLTPQHRRASVPRPATVARNRSTGNPGPGIPVVALAIRLAHLRVARDPASPGDEVVGDEPAHGNRAPAADVADERPPPVEERGGVRGRPSPRASGSRSRRARRRSRRCCRRARARRCRSPGRTG